MASHTARGARGGGAAGHHVIIDDESWTSASPEELWEEITGLRVQTVQLQVQREQLEASIAALVEENRRIGDMNTELQKQHQVKCPSTREDDDEEVGVALLDLANWDAYTKEQHQRALIMTRAAMQASETVLAQSEENLTRVQEQLKKAEHELKIQRGWFHDMNKKQNSVSQEQAENFAAFSNDEQLQAYTSLLKEHVALGEHAEMLQRQNVMFKTKQEKAEASLKLFQEKYERDLERELNLLIDMNNKRLDMLNKENIMANAAMCANFEKQLQAEKSKLQAEKSKSQDQIKKYKDLYKTMLSEKQELKQKKQELCEHMQYLLDMLKVYYDCVQDIDFVFESAKAELNGAATVKAQPELFMSDKHMQTGRVPSKQRAMQTEAVPCNDVAMQTDVIPKVTQNASVQTDVFKAADRWAVLTFHAAVHQLQRALGQVYAVRVANQECHDIIASFQRDHINMEKAIADFKAMNTMLRQEQAVKINALQGELQGELHTCQQALLGTQQALYDTQQELANVLARHSALYTSIQHQAQLEGCYTNTRFSAVSQQMQALSELMNASDARDDAPP
jgi:hypothetical protein